MSLQRSSNNKNCQEKMWSWGDLKWVLKITIPLIYRWKTVLNESYLLYSLCHTLVRLRFFAMQGQIGARQAQILNSARSLPFWFLYHSNKGVVWIWIKSSNFRCKSDELWCCFRDDLQRASSVCLHGQAWHYLSRWWITWHPVWPGICYAQTSFERL